MRHKNQKPPIYIGGSEKLRAMDRPRYMNVPSPAPCHVNVAGVGKQSVWGLRIIAGTQLSLWHYSWKSSIPKSGAHCTDAFQPRTYRLTDMPPEPSRTDTRGEGTHPKSTTELSQQLKGEKFRPSDFMRARHPELFSDSSVTSLPTLTKEVFQYHLELL